MVWAHLVDGRRQSAEASHAMGDEYHIRMTLQYVDWTDNVMQDLNKIVMS